MPARSGWELTPRQSVELECARRGESAVVTGCIALLRGQDVDDGLIHDSPRQRNQYWRRVWGARGLLYAWTPRAAAAIVGGLSDEHWRVREMAAKVIAKREIGEALHEVTTLREDPVPRVRAAAERAIVVLTAAGS
jgi:hypothetical protein